MILQGGYMSKNNYDRIINWPHHHHMILAVSFLFAFFASMPGEGPVWPALIAATIAMPFVGIFVFTPYVLSIWLLAVLFSLPQAIRSIHRHLAPKDH